MSETNKRFREVWARHMHRGQYIWIEIPAFAAAQCTRIVDEDELYSLMDLEDKEYFVTTVDESFNFLCPQKMIEALNHRNKDYLMFKKNKSPDFFINFEERTLHFERVQQYCGLGVHEALLELIKKVLGDSMSEFLDEEV